MHPCEPIDASRSARVSLHEPIYEGPSARARAGPGPAGLGRAGPGRAVPGDSVYRNGLAGVGQGELGEGPWKLVLKIGPVNGLR